MKWADGTKHIPEAKGSVEVVYSSHMLEHLDRVETRAFLRERIPESVFVEAINP
jgi:hypothetical protein